MERASGLGKRRSRRDVSKSLNFLCRRTHISAGWIKSIKLKLLFALFPAAFFFAGFDAAAQLPGTGVSTALTKLFGNVQAFSTRAEVRVLDKSQREWLRTPMDLAMLQGKVRVEVNMNQIAGRNLPADTLANLKQLGLDHVISVARPDRKAMYMIYPRVRSCVNMPMSEQEVAAANQGLRVEKTPLGKEVVSGHPCTKNRMLVKDAKGAVMLEATTWNAGDLKDFPIQIVTKEQDKTTVMSLQQVKFTQPDSRLFELPSGYARYSDSEAMIFGLSKKAKKK